MSEKEAFPIEHFLSDFPEIVISFSLRYLYHKCVANRKQKSLLRRLSQTNEHL